MLIILVEYCAGSTTSKYSWKSCGGQSRAAGQSCASCWKRWAQSADASPLSPSDYAFLLERFVDRTTLHRAEALAKKWGVAASRGDDRQRLAQRLGLLPGFGADLRRSLPRRDRASRSHRASFVAEPTRMSCPRLAQGACERRRLCLRAREIAAERG
jgi:hypothetical protein